MDFYLDYDMSYADDLDDDWSYDLDDSTAIVMCISTMQSSHIGIMLNLDEMCMMGVMCI